MEYRELPKRQLTLSALGFGCWAIGGHGYGKVDDRESVAAIRAALSAGINLFDTADVYGFGYSEKILAKALGPDRARVIVATKGGVRWDDQGRTARDNTPTHLRRSVENSLLRLGLEQIPLYQLHWYDQETPIQDIFGTLLALQGEGKIGHIGTSNVDSHFLAAALREAEIATNQIEYSIANQADTNLLQAMLDELLVGSICYGALARGLLSGKYNKDSSFTKGDTRSRDPNFNESFDRFRPLLEKLQLLAHDKQCSMSQAALWWVVKNPLVTSAIVGMKTAEQVRENCRAVDL